MECFDIGDEMVCAETQTDTHTDVDSQDCTKESANAVDTFDVDAFVESRVERYFGEIVSRTDAHFDKMLGAFNTS